MSREALKSQKRLNEWNLRVAQRQHAEGRDDVLPDPHWMDRLHAVSLSIRKRLTPKEFIASEAHWKRIVKAAGGKLVFEEVVFD